MLNLTRPIIAYSTLQDRRAISYFLIDYFIYLPCLILLSFNLCVCSFALCVPVCVCTLTAMCLHYVQYAAPLLIQSDPGTSLAFVFVCSALPPRKSWARYAILVFASGLLMILITSLGHQSTDRVFPIHRLLLTCCSRDMKATRCPHEIRYRGGLPAMCQRRCCGR